MISGHFLPLVLPLLLLLLLHLLLHLYLLLPLPLLLPYCARVKRKLMPALVLAEGNDVEMTGVLITRS